MYSRKMAGGVVRPLACICLSYLPLPEPRWLQGGVPVRSAGRHQLDAASDEGVTPSEFLAQSPRARSTCSTMSRTAPSPPLNSET